MKPATISDYDQQRVIIQGMLRSSLGKSSSVKAAVFADVARLMILEDIVGDKQFSLLIAMSIPETCQYLQSQETEVGMYDDTTAIRALQLMRTRYYVAGIRYKTAHSKSK
jgi:hypothetical protein